MTDEKNVIFLQPGFRNSSRTDERAAIFNSFKTLPLCHLIHLVYPDLYRVDDLTDDTDDVLVEENEDGEVYRGFFKLRLHVEVTLTVGISASASASTS